MKIEVTNEPGKFIPNLRSQRMARLNLLAFLINILIASLVKIGSCVNSNWNEIIKYLNYNFFLLYNTADKKS